jgi:cathepsin L
LAVFAVAEQTRWFELEDYTFEDYIKEFGKTYGTKEYEQRRTIFDTKLENIRQHNKDSTKSWKKGINHLTDRTEEVNKHSSMKILIEMKRNLPR